MRALLFACSMIVAVTATAAAERYVVQRGETLEYVAKSHGCSTQRVLDANGLDNTLVRPGTVVTVPACRVAPAAKRTAAVAASSAPAATPRTTRRSRRSP